MEFIRSRREQGGPMKVTFSCEGFLGRYEEKVRDLRFFCRAGINIASILIDGRIRACPNIDRDRFSQGSIYEDNFFKVWEERFGEFRGLPCPNIFAGGLNFHGKFEWVTVENMEKAAAVIRNLVSLYAE